MKLQTSFYVWSYCCRRMWMHHSEMRGTGLRSWACGLLLLTGVSVQCANVRTRSGFWCGLLGAHGTVSLLYRSSDGETPEELCGDDGWGSWGTRLFVLFLLFNLILKSFFLSFTPPAVYVCWSSNGPHICVVWTLATRFRTSSMCFRGWESCWSMPSSATWLPLNMNYHHHGILFSVVLEFPNAII